jgi:hypothetical protein
MNCMALETHHLLIQRSIDIPKVGLSGPRDIEWTVTKSKKVTTTSPVFKFLNWEINYIK